MERPKAILESIPGQLVIAHFADVSSISKSNIETKAQEKVETLLTVTSSPPASPSSFVTAPSAPTSPLFEAEEASVLTSNMELRTKRESSSTKAHTEELVLFKKPLPPILETGKLLTGSVALSELANRLRNLEERISRCELRNRSLKLRSRLLQSRNSKLQALKDSLTGDAHTHGQVQTQAGAIDENQKKEVETSHIVSASDSDISSPRLSSDGDAFLDSVVSSMMKTASPEEKPTESYASSDLWDVTSRWGTGPEKEATEYEISRRRKLTPHCRRPNRAANTHTTS